MTKYEPPIMPFVEAKLKGGKQRPRVIFIKPTFTSSDFGSALAIAQRWHRGASFWEAGHYVLDSKKRFRCVRDNVIAGEIDADKGALRIAVCAEPISGDVFWDVEVHKEVLRKTAELVAELTLIHNIKVRYLEKGELSKRQRFSMRRRGGIFIEETVGWPLQTFMDEVNEFRKLKSMK